MLALVKARSYAGCGALVLAGAAWAWIPIELGAAARGVPGPSAAACAPCHAEAAREWEGSLHRRSFSDPLFQAGYRVDHRAFCRGCHAPRSDGADPPPGSLAYDEGITCTECHEPAADREHPSARPEADWRARPCAACHQFHFPRTRSRGGFDPSAWMQRTADEWRASGRAESCIDCHMRERGPLQHTFHVSPERIAGAIAIEGELVPRGGATEAVLRLSNAGAGHAVPTGDVLRALELRVWPRSAPSAVITRTLARRFGTSLRFEPRSSLNGRLVELDDARVPPRGARDVRVVLPGRVDAIGLRLDYLRAQRRHAAMQGIDDAANRIVLHERTIER